MVMGRNFSARNNKFFQPGPNPADPDPARPEKFSGLAESWPFGY
jgi:hypothetical protein